MTLLPAIALLVLTILATPVLAQDPADPAWHEFQHALGAPAPIGANADHPLAASVVRPFPAIDLADVNPRKYLLGSDLYHERALSADNSIGCFICHAGPMSGTDGRTVPRGVAQAEGKVNALSVLNAAFNFRQFWNGRAITLADQALMPLVTPHEMANTLEQVLATLQADAAYMEEFRALYPDGITSNNLADAIAHFERTSFAVTDTPFQHFLQGDTTALTDQEQRGWQRFQEIGCSSCHNGIGLGGNSYQKLGAFQPWFPAVREPGPNDAGLAERTNRAQDLYVVKVPSLHNVAVTEPYLHDGSLDSLQSVTAEMARYQLGRELSEEDIGDIVAFLVALNGAPEGLRLEGEILQLARMQTCGSESGGSGPGGSGPGGSGPGGSGLGGSGPGGSGLARELSDCGTEPFAGRPAPTEPAPTGTLTDHQEAYQTAQATLLPAFARLQDALADVDSGAVAHFDFVQAEHLELIRHARALQHPPSALSAASRQCLQNGASRLLQEVMLLELPIADYLQAKAMRGVVDAHAQHPGADSPPAATLQALRSTLESSQAQALEALRTAPLADSAALLQSCSL
jgi:cytochrome c peroxidase